MKPVTKGLLTDACRGQINIRWVERHGKIPDGPSVGQPFRLMGVPARHSPWDLLRSRLLEGG